MANGKTMKTGEEDVYGSNHRIARLLNCFDNSTQKELLDFCRTISETQAEVYFLMARKASCFFYCLEELGMISLNGYVTSERVLDMDTAWLKDKEVIIIDDAIVSGTTINRTIERLYEAKVKSVKVHVLSVNQKWFQPNMITDKDGNSLLYPNCNVASNEKCISLCYRVVKAILLQPRPYDIDFPLFNEFDIKSENFSKFINIPYWNIFDVSTVEQTANDISSVTFIPTSTAIKDFEEYCNFRISECALIKIRTYIAHKEKNKDLYTISVLPIVVFDKVKTKDIESAFDLIIENTNIERDRFAEITSKLRLVQFYYSFKLAIFWNSFLPDDLGINLRETMLEKKNLRFIFPPIIESQVRVLCASSDQKELPHIEFSKHKEITSEHVSNIDGIDYISIDARLIEPFLDLYHEKELDCRNLVKQKGRDAFKDEKYKVLLERLNNGISIGDLFSIIKYADEYYDCSTKISLFIDRSVDMGIIVPITQVKGEEIFRAFRHGEDVVFGEREETLYSDFLYEFQEESKKEKEKGTRAITHISAEKLIVLFTRFGIDKKILQPYLSNFTINPMDDNDKTILRVKTYLKGPVAVVGKKAEHKKTRNIPYITSEDKSMWLTQVFNKKGLITETDDGLYMVTKPDTSSLETEHRMDVETLGYLLGKVCNKNEETGVTYSDTELTKISTCLTREDCVRAVAAELDIFKHKFSFSSGDLFEKDNKTPIEALNSAFMKLKAFESGEATDLIKNVKFSTRTEQNDWVKAFSKVYDGNTEGSYTEELREYLSTLYYKCKYVAMYALCFVSMLSRAYFLIEKKRTDNKKYADFIQNLDIETECRRIIDETNIYKTEFDKFESKYLELNEIISKTYLMGENSITAIAEIGPDVINDIIQQLVSLMKKTDIVLEAVCCSLSKRGKISKLLRHNQILYLSYRTENYKDNSKAIIRIHRCISLINNKRSDAQLSILQSKYYPEIEMDDTEHQIWFIATGNAGAEALASLTLNLSFYLNDITPLKFVYFGDVDNSISIKRMEDSKGDFMCNGFNNLVNELPASVFFSHVEKSQITIVLPKAKEKTNKFVHYIENAKKQKTEKFKYKRCDSSETTIDDNEIVISNYESRFVYVKDKPIHEFSAKKRIGIITVIEEETDAVAKVLKLKAKSFKYGKRFEYVGDVGKCQVIMTQCLEPGQASVMSSFDYLMSNYKPEMICLAGIAGGLNDDVDYTSVVLAQGIIFYDATKDTKDGIQRRGDGLKVEAKTIPLYQAVKHAVKRKDIKPSDGSKGDSLDIKIGNIASGSAVIAYEKSDLRKWLMSVNDKILACETEAWGLAMACYESELNDKKPAQGLCIIRGISDRADTEKNSPQAKKYRIPAAENAALVLRELIEFFE